jgi:hypothetical protein
MENHVCIILLLVALILALLLARGLISISGGTEENFNSTPWSYEKFKYAKYDIARQNMNANQSPPIPITGGAEAEEVENIKYDKKSKLWWNFSSWEALKKSSSSYKHYLLDRKEALTNLRHDWSHVLKQLNKPLYEKREYIGLINKNKGKLYISHKEPSPFSIDDYPETSKIALSIPAEIARRVASKPALFMFHTHPIFKKVSQIPSPIDLLYALQLGYQKHYAASVLVGEYGVFLFCPSPELCKRMHNSPNPMLIFWRYAFDLVTAFMGMRSWGFWSLQTFTQMLKTYQFMFVAYPSKEYIHAFHTQHFYFESYPNDYLLLNSIENEINMLEGKTKNKPTKYQTSAPVLFRDRNIFIM